MIKLIEGGHLVPYQPVNFIIVPAHDIEERSYDDDHRFILHKNAGTSQRRRRMRAYRPKCREAMAWVRQNRKQHTFVENAHHGELRFERKEDAALFKMFWL